MQPDADVRGQIDALRAEVAELRELVGGRPLTSWRAIARALGVSEATLHRRRRDTGDRAPAWFRDADAAAAWWLDLHREPDAAPTSRKPRSSRKGEALDVRRLVRDLAGEAQP